MADLVRDHIGLRELARPATDVAAAKARRDLIEEGGVEVDLLISRAVERSHRALRGSAATGMRRAAIKNEDWRTISFAVLGEDLLPLQLGAAEHLAHEAAHVVLERRCVAPWAAPALAAGWDRSRSRRRRCESSDRCPAPSRSGRGPRSRRCSIRRRRSEARNHLRRRQNHPLRVDPRRCRFPADRPSAWFRLLARGRSHRRRSGCFSVTTAPINSPARLYLPSVSSPRAARVLKPIFTRGPHSPRRRL